MLLVNEFDYVEGGAAAELFRDNYLAVSQNGARPVDYPYYHVAPVNTGVPSGLDLDNNGAVGGLNDAYGFGLFPGQYGMAVHSKHPIVRADRSAPSSTSWGRTCLARGCRTTRRRPSPADWYSSAELDSIRLSSKSHWDVPISVRGKTVHFLVSHPTPPVFDGPEDRNGTRNADEIRFWADYIGPDRARHFYDDEGRRRPAAEERFVIAGDQNSDPLDGDSLPGSIDQLSTTRA